MSDEVLDSTFSRSHLSLCRRIVVKIGSALLAGPSKKIFNHFASQIASLRRNGHHVVLVSSGAIAQGLPILGIKNRPAQLGQLQAAAAVGQPYLMQRWSAAFGKYNIPVAQVLLTHAGLAHRERFLNARHALFNLEKRGVLPIANENDTVATDEIRVGDNDQLAAHIASLVGADLLILLTTVPALFSANPERERSAERIPLVQSAKDAMRFAGSPGSSGLGVGGMRTKVEAANTATSLGVPVIIAGGNEANILQRLMSGEDVGTLFMPKRQIQGRKHWIAFTLRPKGSIYIDSGAAMAITQSGTSLLPKGLTRVEGNFERGAMVDIHSPTGLCARGLVAYPSEQLIQLIGKPSSEIASILGYIATESIVDRHDLVLLEQ